MEEQLLTSLKMRPGLKEENEDYLRDLIQDSIVEMRAFLNYGETENLPEACLPAVKELTLIRYNRDGTEGISTESQSSGGSTSYVDELPPKVKRVIRKYRRLPR